MLVLVMKKTFSATYEKVNGPLKLRGKLPLPNHAKVRITFVWPASIAQQTRGMFRVSRRLARLIAESDEFSVLNS